MYFITPKIFGSGIDPVNSSGVDKVADSLKLNFVSSVMIKDEVLYTGFRKSE